MQTLSHNHPSASPELISELFGEEFDLWIGQRHLRRIRQGCAPFFTVSSAGRESLLSLIGLSIVSCSVQCRSVAGNLICAVPVSTDEGIGAAVARVRPENAGEVIQRLGQLALTPVRVSQTSPQIPCGFDDDGVSDTRLRADRAEVAWLNQLPSCVLPASNDVSLLSAAERILPQLRELVHARSLLLLAEGSHAPADPATISVLWSCGDIPDVSGIRPLIRRHRDDANNANGLCLNQTTPQSSSGFGVPVLSAVIVPVNSPGQPMAWLTAVNKDLSELASGDMVGRYGTEIGAADVEFGEAEISLMRAAATVLTTNSGIMQLLQDREQLLTGVVRSLVNALDAKDSYTCGHSDRVADFSRLTAEALGVDPRGCEQIHMAGLLHDIGKVGIPDHILTKPSKLTPDEMRVIRQHPVTGYEILRHLRSFEYVLPGVLHHHESFDGTGYPHRLSGTDIPLPARILAVADAWDAMTSSRSYRAGMSPERATEILQEGAGQQWDQQCVFAFLAQMDEVRLRMDAAHDEVSPPTMVQQSAVSLVTPGQDQTSAETV